MREELHRIQAYLSLEKRAPERALDMFRTLLAGLKLLTPAVQEWLRCCRLIPGSGIDCPSLAEWMTAVVDGKAIDVCPYVMAWAAPTIPSLRGEWMEVGLWLKTEQISFTPPDDLRYLPKLVKALYQLTTTFIPISTDAPTFLADAFQDGRSWEAFAGRGDEGWAFDLSVASDGVAWPPEAVPSGFSQIRTSGTRAVARNVIWPIAPWRA